VRWLAAPFTIVALSGAALASPPSWGVRVGVTDDPDSVFVGGQAAFDDIGGTPHLRLEPSLDLGYGQQDTPLVELDYFTIRMNGNVKYLIPIGGHGEMFFYPLAGLSVYYINVNDCSGDCDNTELGINLGVGFELQRFGIELWFGFDDKDLPDITLAGSYLL